MEDRITLNKVIAVSLGIVIIVSLLYGLHYLGEKIREEAEKKSEPEEAHQAAVDSINGIAKCIESYEKALTAARKIDELNDKKHFDGVRMNAELRILGGHEKVDETKTTGGVDLEILNDQLTSCTNKAKELGGKNEDSSDKPDDQIDQNIWLIECSEKTEDSSNEATGNPLKDEVEKNGKTLLLTCTQKVEKQNEEEGKKDEDNN